MLSLAHFCRVGDRLYTVVNLQHSLSKFSRRQIDDIYYYFFLFIFFFTENRGLHLMYITSVGDSRHECQPYFGDNLLALFFGK